MASNVTIAYLADVTDLRTKGALAKSALNEVNAAIREQAAGFANLSEAAKGQALTALQALTAQQASLRSIMQAATGTVREHAAAHGALGSAMNSNRASFMELEHVARSAFDSLASGADPMRILEQEGSRVVQAITELNGVTFSTIAKWGLYGAAIAAVAGAFAYAADRASQFRAAADVSAALNAINVKIPSEQVYSMSRQLLEAGYSVKQLGSLTHEQSESIIRSFGSIRNANEDLIKGLVGILPAYAAMKNLTPEKAAEDLARAMNDLGGAGQRLLASINPADEAMKKFQDGLTTNPLAAQRVMFDQLTDALAKYTADERAAMNQHLSWAEALDPRKNRTPGAEDDVAASHAVGNLGAIADASLSLQKGTDEEPTNLAPDTGAVRDALEKMAQDTSKTHADILAEQTAYVGKLLAIDRMDGEERASLQKTYDQLVVQSRVATGERLIEETRLAAEKAAAAAGSDRAAQAQAEISSYEALLAQNKLTADQKMQVENQVAELQVQLVRRQSTEAKKSLEEQWADFSAAMQEKIAAAKGNFDQQIALAKQWQKEGEALYGQDVAKYKAASDEIIRLTQERASQQLAIQRNMAEAQANLDKIGAKPDVGEFKPSFGLVFDSSALDSQVSAQVAILKAKLNEELAELQADIKGKLNLGDTVGASADYAKATAELASYTDQVQSLNERAAEAVSQSWQKITGPVSGAFDQILSAAISRNQNIGQTAERAGLSIVESYAKAGLQSIAHWAAAQLGMTASTATGTATREAISNTATNSDVQQMATLLAKFVANQSGMTAANATGVAARTATTQAGAAAGKSAEAAAGSQTVMAAAGKAAAGAYASVAQIPFVGWILAPAAAAVAFGAVAAYETVASAEGGWDQVPADGTPAILHQNEMVLPASIAQSVRDMAARGLEMPRMAGAADLAGSSSTVNNSGDTNHNITINHSPTINVAGTTTGSSANMAAALRRSNQEMYQTFNNWRGTGSQNKLPGR